MRDAFLITEYVLSNNDIMKKVVATLFAICIFITANAQIQKQFWGLEFSKEYSSLEDAKNIISDRCECATLERDGIYAKNGSFGGYDWEYIQFQFYRKADARILTNVAFANWYSTKDAANEREDSLYSALCNKYGTWDYINADEGYIVWNEYNTGGEPIYYCMLSMSQTESEAWVVSIVYTDICSTELAEKQNNEEL
jgi:hypothetical protein